MTAPLLTEQIRAFYRGPGDENRLCSAVRDAVLVVPQVHAKHDGVSYLFAFTDPEQLARFAVSRGDGDREWDYATVRGDRLLDSLLPTLDQPAVVVVDAAGARPMVFPGAAA